MIRKVLDLTRKELQAFFDNFNIGKEVDSMRIVSVVLSNILDQDGKIETIVNSSGGADHSLVITLINIEEEKHLKPPPAIKELNRQFIVKQNPEINLNLYVLLTAFSSHYETSLGIISDAIKFFQSKHIFNHSNTPALDVKIEKIIADLFTLTFEQQNYLWSMMGVKYLPSVMYKLRMLSIDDEQIKDKVKPVKEITISD
ncbi:DUF4255 domain-containing protein [Draconibacterium sp.]|nr:DUF4255 domain-containing protein [Draconibacterium sp.]